MNEVPLSCNYWPLYSFYLIVRADCVCIFFAAPTIPMELSGEPSLSAMPSGRPSLSIQPSVEIGIASYYGHELVGEGKCLGKQFGNHIINTAEYNYLEFLNVDLMAKLCPETCAVYRTHSKYRGFEFEPGKCRCLFDREINFSTDLEGRDGSPTNEVINKLASGPVTSSDRTLGTGQCYAKSVPESPEGVDNFEYVGYGECWDSSMATYEYIEIDLSQDGYPIVACGAACSPSNYPQSRGFVAKQGLSCNCLFDDGYENASVTTERAGTGRIDSSNYVEGHCYRALPAPTNFPTKVPTPKPVSNRSRGLFCSDSIWEKYCF